MSNEHNTLSVIVISYDPAAKPEISSVVSPLLQLYVNGPFPVVVILIAPSEPPHAAWVAPPVTSIVFVSPMITISPSLPEAKLMLQLKHRSN